MAQPACSLGLHSISCTKGRLSRLCCGSAKTTPVMRERSSPGCLLTLRTWALCSAYGQQRRVFHGRPDCKTLAVGSHRAGQADSGHRQCMYHHLRIRRQQKARRLQSIRDAVYGNIAGHCASLLGKTVSGQKLTKRWQ